MADLAPSIGTGRGALTESAHFLGLILKCVFYSGVGLALQETPKGEGHNGAQGPGVTGITPLVIGTSLSFLKERGRSSGLGFVVDHVCSSPMWSG
jgi:hypothetical protein